MSNHTAQIGEPVFYFEWVTDHYQQWDAVVRVIPGDAGHPQHPKLHLRVDQEELPGGFKNVNNILNEEIADIENNEDYWVKRFSTWPPA